MKPPGSSSFAVSTRPVDEVIPGFGPAASDTPASKRPSTPLPPPPAIDFAPLTARLDVPVIPDVRVGASVRAGALVDPAAKGPKVSEASAPGSLSPAVSFGIIGLPTFISISFVVRCYCDGTFFNVMGHSFVSWPLAEGSESLQCPPFLVTCDPLRCFIGWHRSRVSTGGVLQEAVGEAIKELGLLSVLVTA